MYAASKSWVLQTAFPRSINLPLEPETHLNWLKKSEKGRLQIKSRFPSHHLKFFRRKRQCHLAFKTNFPVNSTTKRKINKKFNSKGLGCASNNYRRSFHQCLKLIPISTTHTCSFSRQNDSVTCTLNWLFPVNFNTKSKISNECNTKVTKLSWQGSC